MREIDIFLLHGVENKIDTITYYQPFVKRICENMTAEERAHVRFHPVNYSVILEEKEKTILSWMKHDHWQRLREFGCFFIGDILAYAHPKRPAEPGDPIYDIHKLLAEVVANVMVDHPKSEKWIIAHSLGCVVGFGFSWDIKIDCLITMGNPHNYFSIRFKNFGQDNPNLPHFFNFHDPWDPISTRVSENPNFTRVYDVVLKNWNPWKKLPIRAHVAYWKSKELAKRLADLISRAVSAK